MRSAFFTATGEGKGFVSVAGGCKEIWFITLNLLVEGVNLRL
jgi:hypothetical protein